SEYHVGPLVTALFHIARLESEIAAVAPSASPHCRREPFIKLIKASNPSTARMAAGTTNSSARVTAISTSALPKGALNNAMRRARWADERNLLIHTHKPTI